MRKLLLLISLFFSVQTFAQVRLPSLFSDGMVFQQKTKAKIWGFASEEERVKVKTSWDNRPYFTTSNDSGKWELEVSTPTAGGPYSIEISGKNRLWLKNVMVGEVWICSGQSNMDMPVRGYFNSPVQNSGYILQHSPNKKIRLFKVGKNTAINPSDSLKGRWEQADPSSVIDFSTVGYLFGKDLQDYLNVPVGIIQITWGGSPIEAWMSKPSLEKVSQSHELKGGATSKAVHQIPSHIYNGMVSPVVGYKIAGIIWYQGEQNRHNYEDYRWLLPEMINSWRAEWENEAWLFFYVQIAPMIYPEKQRYLVPLLREVQWKVASEIPNSGVANSLDAGDISNIHPSNKQPIANRLLALALNKHYGKAIPSTAPCYREIVKDGESLKITFKDLQMGLTSFGKTLEDFEVAGNDKVFYPAKAEIKGGEVIVKSEKVHEPVAVRYAFKDWVIGSLYGVNGLPVAPFRSDNWR